MIANQTARKPRPAASAKPPKSVNVAEINSPGFKYRWLDRLQDDPELPRHSAFAVAYSLTRFINDKKSGSGTRKARPSVRKIAALAQASLTSTKEDLKWLHDRGWLAFEDGIYQTKIRVLTLPAQMAEPSALNLDDPAAPAATPSRPGGDNEHCTGRPERTDRVDQVAVEPNNPSPDQPKEQQAGRVEIDDRPCHEQASIPPRDVIDAKAVEFIERAYPNPRNTFTDAEKEEGAREYRLALMRGVDADLILWAAWHYRAKTQRDQGRRPEAPFWWMRNKRWQEHPNADQFIATAGDAKARRRMMGLAESAGSMR